MQALMLAAGMGKRLGKYTKDCTKCMVMVSEKRLIDRAIEALKYAGIDRLIMVVGYQGKKLEEYLTSTVSGMEISFIYNDDYQNTNNIYSLYMAKDELVKDDTILLESDLIYDYRVIKDIVDDAHANMVAVAKYEQWMDGTVVLLDEKRRIVDFVEKADFRFASASDYYKTVNIYKFSKEFSAEQYIPFLEAYIKAYGKNQYYEMVLKILAHVRFSDMRAMVLEDYKWYEIDDEQDLQIAQAMFASEDKQFHAYDHQYGGFWRFPKLKDFCYLVNPYYPPQKMLDHMRYFYETLLRQYPSGLKIQNMNAGRMLGINNEHVLVGNGAAELIHLLGNVLHGKMLIQIPVFNEYVRCFPDCELYELKNDTFDFAMPMEEIIQNLDQVDIVALVNPDNPSGNFYTYREMEALLSACKEKGKKCIIDESFVDFAEKELRYTLLKDEILEQYPDLIVIKSISKSYGVPGLRLGILASADEAMLKQLKDKLPIWNINSFAEYFLQIHNLYEKDYMAACDQIAIQRKRMENELRSNEYLRVYPSQANYIMCELKGKMTAEDLANVLVRKYNILIKDLSGKPGVLGENFIRIAVKDQAENKELVTAIRKELY